MRISMALGLNQFDNPAEFMSVAAIAEMARALETAGIDACYVTDHPAPAHAWLAAGGHSALDPFVQLTAVAAVSTKLKLHSQIVVLPYRNPFLTAKAAASLDVISGGRMIMGVGVGYMKAEFAALGVPSTVLAPTWVLPVPSGVVKAAGEHDLVVTLEDGLASGGIGAAITEACARDGVRTTVRTVGLPTSFLDHASRDQVVEAHRMSAGDVVADVVRALGR